MALVGIAEGLLAPTEQASGSASQQAPEQAYGTLLPWSSSGAPLVMLAAGHLPATALACFLSVPCFSFQFCLSVPSQLGYTLFSTGLWHLFSRGYFCTHICFSFPNVPSPAALKSLPSLFQLSSSFLKALAQSQVSQMQMHPWRACLLPAFVPLLCPHYFFVSPVDPLPRLLDLPPGL